MAAPVESASTSEHRANVSPNANDERRQRKKIQNRLNQRAHRRRIREQNILDKKIERRRHPYTIDRWRLEDYEAPSASESNTRSYHDCQAPSQSSRNVNHYRNAVEKSDLSMVATLSATTVDSSQSPRMKLQLPADHLLHLIYYNVFRGLLLNKDILERTTVHFVPYGEHFEVFNIHSLFPGYSAVTSAHSADLPTCLSPTHLQTTLVHSTWIDLLPFPKMRENLIRWDAHFDHAELISDVVGNLIDGELYSMPWSSQVSPVAKRVVQLRGDDELTTGRRGLIIWGEPYQAESWEATPGFLQKWPWVVEGCEELIRSSNHWRMTRGENPLQLSITEDVPSI
ncbi:hypothetical protein F5884DRAFT_789016 [Xylogone sp. PMI_703]|nr:hypothetical protein F5884DRAFT_789016 [Xylogone sp. PMI_703]